MDEYQRATRASYAKHSAVWLKKYRALWEGVEREELIVFLAHIPGKKILDIGCAAGDQALYFTQKGYEVTGIDTCVEMLEECTQRGIKAQLMDAEDMNFEGTFDGIWAVSSLLHIPKSRFNKVAEKIVSLLNKGGVLFIALKEGTGEGFAPDGRFFAYWQEQELREAFGALQVLESWKSEVQGQKYVNILFKKM